MGERENCITVALSPETVTIDGNIVGTDDRRWSDLLLDRAVLREHSAALEALLGAEAAQHIFITDVKGNPGEAS